MGWDDLHNFCAQALDWAGLPATIDYTTADEQAAAREDPYEDAVRVVLSDKRPGRACEAVVDEFGTLVQFAKVVKRYEDLTGERLPGGGAAMQRYFETKGYRVERDVRHYSNGQRTSYRRIMGWWAEPYEPDALVDGMWAPGRPGGEAE